MSQINPKFYLKNPNKKTGLSVIMIRAYPRTGDFRNKTGLSINQKYWDSNAQKPITEVYEELKRACKDDPQLAQKTETYKELIKEGQKVNPQFQQEMRTIASRLNTMAVDLGLMYDFILNQVGYVEPEQLKESFNKKYFPEKLEKKELKTPNFFQSYDQYLEIKKNEFKVLTIKKHRTTRDRLLEFQSDKKYKVEFDTINMVFIEKFKKYLIDDGLLNDTILKYIKTIKAFMEWALDMEYHNNETYKKKKFSINTLRNLQIITLSSEEFKRITELDLSSKERLERVQDLFIVMTYTAQRISDVIAFKKEDVSGDTWTLTQKKTNSVVKIPLDLLPRVKGILEKYDNKLPTISGTNFNIYLKEIGELAGLDETIIKHRLRGSKNIEIKRKKYEFLSSHICRRTCVTLLIEEGKPLPIIMQLTGHKDVKTLMKYANIGEESVRNELGNNPISF